jgi:DNA-binding MarR family transcriptional regulator
MNDDDALRLDDQLCFALYATTRAMMQTYEPLLAELGVTYPQYVALMALWEKDGVSVKQLGERMFLDSGTLTPLLKRLEEAGLVDRARSVEDERVVEVRLTEKGRRLRKKACAVPPAIFAKAGMSAKELTRLRTELRRLFHTLTRDDAGEKDVGGKEETEKEKKR